MLRLPCSHRKRGALFLGLFYLGQGLDFLLLGLEPVFLGFRPMGLRLLSRELLWSLVSSIPSLLEVFIMNGSWILSQAFSTPIYMTKCHHSEDALIWRTSEGLFDLCFPPHCCLHFLWDGFLHVFSAQPPPFQEHRQSGACVLRHSHPHAESTDL